MKKRTLSWMLAAAIVAGSLAGCGGGSTETTAASGGQETTAAASAEAGAGTEAAAGETSGKDSLVIAMASDILSMDPYRYDEGPTNQVMLHMYEGLVRQAADMSFEPCLAESWDTSEDGLTWTFHLRKGVKFHDGEEMDSADALASIKTAMNPDSPSAFSSYTSSFTSVEAPDAETIVITTDTINPLMLFDLAQIYILKQENVEGKTEEEIAAKVVGTGRYKFVEQVKEDHIDMVANEDYWGEVPAIKNVRFRPITNEATRTATMLTGEVDFTIGVSVRDIDRLENTEGISVLRQKGLREIYLNLDSREDSPLFPGQKNPMSDPKVRQAMYLAIDESAIIKSIMNGCAFEMNSIVPEGYVGYKEVSREAYDPEKAKALLAEAGYPDGFEVTLDAPNDRYMNDAQIAQAVAGFLEKVGIKVNLNLMPKANFFSYIKPVENNSMFLMTGWSDSSGDGLSLAHDMLHTYDREAGKGTVNRGHYSNAEVDALIEQALTELDDAKRGELVAQIDEIARADYAYIPLHFEQDTNAIKDTLNYTPRMNNYVFAWEFSYK
ncbi:ABC transporter substrate-binding protein [Lacrimispora sp. 210928-DFI.3.58]|uniref:ABC transporter substrate-binding protein n=1 Tax=Lacrimispora sp. 210928-DFI.3.58 TaxID=2883214 RepID=UPI001D07560B|nr:ABC transporter substrate-binding protein [Lacrimispora sp. 210928-DFI.3.58]MCB7320357.1 ABC transporter substrate-binding protein [Lacrimispora sp. 210928-DFI.3.58]